MTTSGCSNSLLAALLIATVGEMAPPIRSGDRAASRPLLLGAAFVAMYCGLMDELENVWYRAGPEPPLEAALYCCVILLVCR